ncbi:MAG: hypothetical protein WBN60_03165 [Polyangiales bacterium]
MEPARREGRGKKRAHGPAEGIILRRPDCGGRLRFEGTIMLSSAKHRILRTWIVPPGDLVGRRVALRTTVCGGPLSSLLVHAFSLAHRTPGWYRIRN